MTLTDRAAAHINSILASRGTGGAGVRIGVKKGGCAGMEYTMEWAGEPQPHDEVVEHNGARVLIEGMDAAQVGELAHRERVSLHELASDDASLEQVFFSLTEDMEAA